MYPFQYHRPDMLAKAQDLSRSASEGKFLAGGMTLLPTMKQRLANPSDLIDLQNLPAISGIEVSATDVKIGAMTRHSAVAASKEIIKALPALAHLARGIGDPHVRHRGTIGGSVANNDPSADYPAAVLALGATIQTDRRTIAADDFFLGMFETALAAGEIILRISFPIPVKAAYYKFQNPVSRYALVGVFVAQFASGPRVAVTGAAAGVFRQKDYEKALAGEWSALAIAGISQASQDLADDIHASAEYRAHLVNVITRRAIDAAG